MTLTERAIVTADRDQLRHEPLAKRIRAVVDGATVLDTVAAHLVWEPRRVLAEYAVPTSDLDATLTPGAAQPAADDRGTLGPAVPFGRHSTPGTTLDVTIGDRVRRGAAFRPDAPDLAGLVVLDFGAFDEWYHEDERNVGHARDPYHRVESLPSSRTVTVSLGDLVVARSATAVAIFESEMPSRFYLPPDAVRVELMPSDTVTWCAYKGRASYVSLRVGGDVIQDAAWFYPDALPDAALARGYYCFDDSKLTVTVSDS